MATRRSSRPALTAGCPRSRGGACPTTPCLSPCHPTVAAGTGIRNPSRSSCEIRIRLGSGAGGGKLAVANPSAKTLLADGGGVFGGLLDGRVPLAGRVGLHRDPLRIASAEQRKPIRGCTSCSARRRGPSPGSPLATCSRSPYRPLPAPLRLSSGPSGLANQRSKYGGERTPLPFSAPVSRACRR